MSRLVKISEEYRKNLVAKNTYNKNDVYSGTHPNALSDGDNRGKGEKNGSVGSSDDIKARNEAKTKNKYTLNKPYNDSTA